MQAAAAVGSYNLGALVPAFWMRIQLNPAVLSMSRSQSQSLIASFARLGSSEAEQPVNCRRSQRGAVRRGASVRSAGPCPRSHLRTALV